MPLFDKMCLFLIVKTSDTLWAIIDDAIKKLAPYGG